MLSENSSDVSWKRELGRREDRDGDEMCQGLGTTRFGVVKVDGNLAGNIPLTFDWK